MKPGVIDNLSSSQDKSLNDVECVARSRLEMRMLLKCKSCGKLFNSTFTAEEFAAITKEQNESGTLHLCPHCGNLSTYLPKDYIESA